MGMKINLECLYCVIDKADSLYDQYGKGDSVDKQLFMKEVFNMASKDKAEDTAPYMTSRVMRLLKDRLGLEDIYTQVKEHSNAFMLEIEEKIGEDIHQAEWPLMRALQYAMVGNYIDYGAMDHVDHKVLLEIIENAKYQKVDEATCKMLEQALEKASKITILLDNAGEVVFDKLLIKLIQKLYPQLTLTAVVRGGEAFNDVTLTEAEAIGLTDVVHVIDNGTEIPGTQLNQINDQTKRVMDNSDLILSKGQGNFESLYGCGKNIYYIFLCKCDLFARRFKVEKFTGIFASEKGIHQLAPDLD